MAEVLERVAESVPVLLVEQNLAVVRRLARDAVVLAAGKVAWTGDGRPSCSAEPELTSRCSASARRGCTPDVDRSSC